MTASFGIGLSIGAVEHRFWKQLCEYLDVPEFTALQHDEKYREEILDFMRTAFKKKTLAQWETELADLDVCWGRIQNLKEVLESEQNRIEFSTRGGAIIGSATLFWPSVKLAVYHDELVVIPSFKILFSGTDEYVFPHNLVTSLERRIFIPYIGWGMQINHHVPHLPQRIIFWCFENPENLIHKIHEAGFIAAINK